MAEHGKSEARLRAGRTLLAIITACVVALGVAFLLGYSRDESKPAAAPSKATVPEEVPPVLSLPVQPDVSPTQRHDFDNPNEGTVDADDDAQHDAFQVASLDKARDELALQSTAALDGIMFVNEVLDHMLQFASLPIATHPDFDYEDNDAIAYNLQGTPEGTEARLLVGMRSYVEGDKSFRYLQLHVDMNVGQLEYLRDSMREGPQVDLSISYAESDEADPTRFAVMLKRPVSLGASRKAGIDAYSGQYTSGAYYWIDFLNAPHEPTTTTIGIVNGSPVAASAFPGISPLSGDIQIDRKRVAALLKQLQMHLSTIKGK